MRRRSCDRRIATTARMGSCCAERADRNLRELARAYATRSFLRSTGLRARLQPETVRSTLAATRRRTGRTRHDCRSRDPGRAGLTASSFRVNRFREAQTSGPAADGESAAASRGAAYRTLVERLPGFTYISALDDSGLGLRQPPARNDPRLSAGRVERGSGLSSCKLIHPDDRERVLEEGRIFRQETGPGDLRVPHGRA